MGHESKRMPKVVDSLTVHVDRWFSVAAVIVIDIMALFSLIALLYATWGVGQALFSAILGGHPEVLYDVIVQILTVFIIVEVLSVSVHFLRANRIDLRDLVDVTLAIVFREVWVGMFSGELHWQELIALALLIASLGVMRYLMHRAGVKPHVLAGRTQTEAAVEANES